MHAELTGAGEPVLLLHGGGVAGWMWRPVLDHLGGHVQVIVPDLPGHGRSVDTAYLSHDDTIDRLIRLIEETAPTGALVVGFSLGAQLALRLASEHPRLVRGAVVVSAEVIPAPMPRATLALLRWAAPLARRPWFARLQARQLAIPAALLPDYVAESRAISRDTLLASVRDNIRFSPPDAWQAFAGPAAILVGERERRLMLDSARMLHAALPSSELLVVPDAAHDVPFTKPALLAARIHAIAESIG